MREIALMAALLGAPAAAAAEEVTAASDDSGLAHEVTLEKVLAVSLARNPDLAEARARARAAAEGAPASGRWPEPEVKVELWGVPLARPHALGDSDTIMVGLRQSIPAPGSRGARARAAAEEARMVELGREAREQDLVAQVRRAYFEHYRAEREYRIHLEHVALTERMLELARVSYRAGRGTQQDVLRMLVELSRLHDDVASLEQERASARSLLNSLMGRSPEAPLGPAAEPAMAKTEPRLAELELGLEARLPELGAAERAVRRSQAAAEATRSVARWPSFMVGADYWYMPMNPSPHGYGAMVSMTLPWLGGRRADELREAEYVATADARALEAARNAARHRLRDAFARHQAAANSLAILDRDLLPQARQSLEATQAAFGAGQGDAIGLIDSLRMLLDVRLQRIRAMARLGTSRAELDRAAGMMPSGVGAAKENPRG